jgi:Rieske Fe-S protein
MENASQAAGTTRRTVVALAGAGGLAAALAACGGTDDHDGSAASAGGSGSQGGTLAKTTDIPEGGGKVFAAQKVVVTQPSSGQFKCFSAICTHQGCTVSQVADGTIDCPCHGSKFHIADGSVAGGPAPSPLDPRKITVSGGEIKLA